MNIRMIATSGTLVLFLGACAGDTETAKERSIFIRKTATAKTYEGDLVLCDAYVNTKGASGGEQTGAVVTSLLLGGVVGAAAANNAYEQSHIRLFEECMFSRGYRLVALPESFAPQSTSAEEYPKFDRRKVALDLISRKQVDELITWEDAKNSSGTEGLQYFLRTYPDGPFAAEARKLLESRTKSAAAPAK